MRYFAELDEDNIVINVIDFDNDIIENNRGSDNADTWVTSSTHFTPSNVSPTNKIGVRFLETYTDGTRKQKAGIKFSYDVNKDKFLTAKPYPSWVLNSDDDWSAPTTAPSTNPDGETFDTIDKQKLMFWNEDNTRWEHQPDTESDLDNYWNGSSWVSI